MWCQKTLNLYHHDRQQAWEKYEKENGVGFPDEFFKGFDAGRDSVIFPPLSEFRDKFREMICEGDFDFTKIFEEIEYEGETYADISNEGADALADYFLNLFTMIDEWRSAQVGYKCPGRFSPGAAKAKEMFLENERTKQND